MFVELAGLILILLIIGLYVVSKVGEAKRRRRLMEFEKSEAFKLKEQERIAEQVFEQYRAIVQRFLGCGSHTGH